VYAAMGACDELLRALMAAVPRKSVSPNVRIQVMALVTNVANARLAVRQEVIEIPVQVREQLDAVIYALAGALGITPEDDGEGENATAGGSDPTREGDDPDGDSAEGK